MSAAVAVADEFLECERAALFARLVRIRGGTGSISATTGSLVALQVALQVASYVQYAPGAACTLIAEAAILLHAEVALPHAALAVLATKR
ncbi:hypothetical protein, partial [Marinobacter sp.]|uniref:hypothetical protein n=2 Tax=Marinobacter sp. TaxID=50741 RepID=UPI003298BEDB